ncbi:MAG TPA: CheR family methyltransferase [Burkholderiaceae bacterium]|jgi:chemotaxis protein methyltransferase CheR|nr:CheR family methyltransferase [Burkholderiaceae bacterium]
MKRDTSIEDIEVELLLEGIFQLFGVDLRNHLRAPLKRKLHQLMHETGATTVSALQNQVMHDGAIRDALLHALCPRPESIVPDPEYWKSLRVILGSYLSSFPSPRIWIVECSDAHDADILSIMLEEERLSAHAQIFATSSNEAIVRESRKGEDGRTTFGTEIQDRIIWSQFNISTDSTFNEFQLIICRNALTDCGSSLKRHVLNLFHESLSTFGILNINGVSEIEAAPFSTQFRKLPLEGGWYKHVA